MFFQKWVVKTAFKCPYFEGDVSMTEKEKNHIIKLRESGMSYTKISNATGMTVGGVKAFFSRYNRSVRENLTELCCIYCGAKLPKKQRTKPFKFYSPACRHKWWVKNNEYQQTCAVCGRQFQTKHKNQEYCSHSCYISDRYGKAVTHNV